VNDLLFLMSCGRQNWLLVII